MNDHKDFKYQELVEDNSAQEYLDQEWSRDDNGIHHRKAARIVAVNEADELLLLRGHDFSNVEHWWWFTVGGGLKGTESAREGALREFAEETGVRLNSDQLIGPVLRRYATFDFHAVTCRQDEDFFFTRISRNTIFSQSGFTEVENQVIDELRWWSLEELCAEIQSGAVVYPLELVEYTRSWLRGWDGNCPEITEGTVGMP